MKMKKISVLIIWLPFFTGLAIGQEKKVVLLSKSYGNGSYENWLLSANPGLKIVSLYHVSKDSVDFWLKASHGILMTGGEDVYPGRYEKEKDTADCGEFDLRRDSLEFRMLDHAFAHKKPLFGICRGLQIINIHQNGNLVVDIPSKLGVKVRHRENGPVEHEVEIVPTSSLGKISKIKKGKILSNHHQGIDVLGKNLKPMARSEDGLIEAIEGDENSKMPFLMAVQWHPERMEKESPLSNTLSRIFSEAVLKQK